MTAARLVGADAAAFAAPLFAAGLTVAVDAAAVVHVVLRAPALAQLEDALAGWVADARAAAAAGGDVVTVVGDALLDGDDVAGCALGHGLVSATRAYAMERDRSGEAANVVAADPDDLARAARAVAWLLRERVVSGDVLQTGARRHGRQRL